MLFKHWICMPFKKHGHLLIVVGLNNLWVQEANLNCIYYNIIMASPQCLLSQHKYSLFET